MQAIVIERGRLDELISRRKRLIEQRRGIDVELHHVEVALASLTPAPTRKPPPVVRGPINAKPLAWMIYEVLGNYPVTLAQIVGLVQPLYRTKSPTEERFTACVEKALIRLIKAGAVEKANKTYRLSSLTRDQVEARMSVRD